MKSTPHPEKAAPGTAPSRTSDHLFPYSIAVLFLPLLVLWRHTDALFSPLWYADPWFYLGHFRNLIDFKRELFPGSYYGSRLAWIVPGFLVHSVFPPLVANWILHLGVQWTATLSFFFTLRWTAGVRAAFLATMVFSVQPWLWAATGWDYPDGAGIAYFLLAMALLTRSALQPAGKGTLLLAGMALAGMAYTHIFLATFAPLAVLYYLGLVWMWHRESAGRLAGALALWTGAGIGLVTLGFCAINYLLDGKFWFYAPSVERALFMAKDFQFVRSIWQNHQLVPWLWPAVAGCCAAVALLPSRLRAVASRSNAVGILLSVQLLLAVSYMIYLQKRGTTVLGHHPYVSYLLPFAFLVMSVSFWPAVETMSLRSYVPISCAAALIFAALWYNPAGFVALSSPTGQRITGVVCSCALGIALLLRNRKVGPLFAVAGFAALAAMAMGQIAGVGWSSLHSTSEEYARVMQTRQRIEDTRKDSPIRFWYDKQEPPFFEYLALNSTYLAEFNRISDSFPTGCGEPIDTRSLIVVTSQKDRAAELARSALNDCWQPFGIRARVESSEVIHRRNDSYTMSLLRIEPAASSGSSAGELFATIPLEKIRLAAPGAVLERRGEELSVTTLPGVGAFAGSVPLGLDPAQHLKFAVHVRLRVTKGKVGVGILDPANKMFLVEYPSWPGSWRTEVVLPLPSPPAVGELVIRNLMTNKISSSAMVDRIEIWKLP